MKAFRTVGTTVGAVAAAVAMVAAGSGLVGGGGGRTASASSRPGVSASASGSVRSSLRSTPAAASSGSTSGSVDARVLHRPDEQVDPGADTGHWSSMYEFMQYVVEDSASVWNWYYQQWGVGAPSTVSYVFPNPGEAVQTGCGDVTNDNTMEYCPADDTIYFSQSIATRLWDGSFVGPDGQSIGAPGGDFAVAFLVAHEYGHNVQAELGISAAVYGTPRHEQQADCYAGAFTHVAYYQGILDGNDVNEGVAGAFVAGDSAFDNPGHHGTSDERMQAFSLGYNAEGPAACDAILQG